MTDVRKWSGEFYAVTTVDDEDDRCFASVGDNDPPYCCWISSGAPCGDLFAVEEQAQRLADELNQSFDRVFVVKRFVYQEIDND